MAIEMVVHGMGQAPESNTPLVLLKEKERERYLIIGIGQLEMAAIAAAAMNIPPPRPQTHDLLVSALEACGAKVTHAVIHSVIDQVFHARLVLDVQGRHVELDSRSSDAIAVAVRVGISVYAEEAVLDQAGIIPQAEGAGGPDAGDTKPEDRIREDQLGAFRDVIKGLNLDDLDRPKPSS